MQFLIEQATSCQGEFINGYLPSLIYDAVRAYPELLVIGVQMYKTLDTWAKSSWNNGFSDICLGLLKLAIENESNVALVLDIYVSALPTRQIFWPENQKQNPNSDSKIPESFPFFNAMCRYHANETIFNKGMTLLWLTDDEDFNRAVSSFPDMKLAVILISRMFRIAISGNSGYYSPVMNAWERALSLWEGKCEAHKKMNGRERSNLEWPPYPYVPFVSETPNDFTVYRQVFDDFKLPIILRKRSIWLPFFMNALQQFPDDDSILKDCSYMLKGELPSSPWPQGFSKEIIDLRTMIKSGDVLDLLGDSRFTKRPKVVELLLEILSLCKAGDEELLKRGQAAVLLAMQDFKHNAKITELGNVVLRLTVKP